MGVASDMPAMSLEDFGPDWLAKVRSSCLHMVSNKGRPQASRCTLQEGASEPVKSCEYLGSARTAPCRL